MELPLVEEIREARRLAEEAGDAAMQLQRVNAILAMLSALEGQDFPPGFKPDLPGDEVVDMVADRWSQLADLRSADPRPGCPVHECLQARRQQMEAAWRELKPLADTAQHRTHHLAHLQEEQREILDSPRFASVVAELHAIGVERERYVLAIGPLQQRLGQVGPAANVVATLDDHITSEAEQLRMVSDPTGMSSWRALTVAEALLEALRKALVALALDVPTPRGPAVRGTVESASREDVLGELERIHTELHSLHAALEAQRAHLDAEVGAVTAKLDALTKQLVDRMG